MRALIEAPCWLFHRLWWVPLWNQSHFLVCPISWACHHSKRFDRWFWNEAHRAPGDMRKEPQ